MIETDGLPHRLLIWTVMPTHHQSAFIAALRDNGFDVVVHYYDRISEDRRLLGWNEFNELPAGERYVPQSVRALSLCPDWRERTHILPGYAKPFLIALAGWLSVRGVTWLHWSEPSRAYARTWRGELVRRLYGTMVERFALGALAMGEMARRDFWRWGISDERIRYLPYSVAPLAAVDVQMQRSVKPSAGIRFLFVGALCHRKGIDVLLSAFSRVLAWRPDARLSLVGADQANGAYLRQAQRLGITHAVAFMPPCAANQIATPMANADVLILPSRFDGWGVVINEATSLGKAVIATSACGAAHHLIREGESGFVVAPDDVEKLADRMNEYCRDPDLAQRHGEVSRQLFQSVLPERNAQRLREALQSLLAAAQLPVAAKLSNETCSR